MTRGALPYFLILPSFVLAAAMVPLAIAAIWLLGGREAPIETSKRVKA